MRKIVENRRNSEKNVEILEITQQTQKKHGLKKTQTRETCAKPSVIEKFRFTHAGVVGAASWDQRA